MHLTVDEEPLSFQLIDTAGQVTIFSMKSIQTSQNLKNLKNSCARSVGDAHSGRQ